MEVTLLPKYEAILADHLSSGRYPSVDEVFQEALDALAKRAEREKKKEELRAYLQIGMDEIERGEGIETTVDEIYAEVVAEG